MNWSLAFLPFVDEIDYALQDTQRVFRKMIDTECAMQEKLKKLCILCLSVMSGCRGQGDPVGAVLTAVIMTIIAVLGIYLFSEFNQTITITGSLAGAGENLLIDAADALLLAVGGTGITVTAILILRGAGR